MRNGGGLQLGRLGGRSRWEDPCPLRRYSQGCGGHIRREGLVLLLDLCNEGQTLISIILEKGSEEKVRTSLSSTSFLVKGFMNFAHSGHLYLVPVGVSTSSGTAGPTEATGMCGFRCLRDLFLAAHSDLLNFFGQLGLV